MLLVEVFKDVAPYSWTETGSDFYQAQFIIDPYMYEVNFYRFNTEKRWFRKPSGFWVVEFKILNPKEHGADKHGISGTGNAGSVLGTVVHIMQEFVQKVKPDIMKFEAKEESRRKLYRAMLARFMKQYPNVKAKVSRQDVSDVFELRFK